MVFDSTASKMIGQLARGWSPPEGDFVQRCYRCGLKPGGDSVNAPWQPIDITGAPSPEQASKQPTPDVRAADAEPANVVQLPPPSPKRVPATLGIHNARLPNGQPARMRRTDYSGINAGGVYNPLEKAPNWSAAHPPPMPDFK